MYLTSTDNCSYARIRAYTCTRAVWVRH